MAFLVYNIYSNYSNIYYYKFHFESPYSYLKE